MGSNSKNAYAADGRTEALLYLPEQLKLVTDKGHPLYDPRVNLPVSQELVHSILEHGVLENVLVRKNGEENGIAVIEVVDGRQRVRAAIEANKALLKAGKKPIRVPAFIVREDDKTTFGIMVATNEIRQDDDPVTKGEKAQRMLKMGATMEEVCRAFGCSDQSIALYLKTLELHPDVQQRVKSGALALSVAARELSKLSREKQLEVLKEMETHGVTKGKKGEKAARNLRNGKGAREVAAEGDRVRSRRRIEALLAVAEGESGKEAASIAVVLRWVLGGSIKKIPYGDSFPLWAISTMADQEE